MLDLGLVLCLFVGRFEFGCVDIDTVNYIERLVFSTIYIQENCIFLDMV